MIGKRLFASVFPRPRSPVRLRSAWPLVAFLAAFGGLWLGLELSGTLLFARPAALGLIVFAVWIWWMHLGGYSGLGRGRALAALLTRLTLLGLFVMLLAEPRAVRTSDVLSVVYAVDISDSIDGGSVDEALQFVTRTVTAKPAADHAGIIAFGRNAAVELPPRPTFPLEAGNVINSLIDRDSTNLAQALSLAAAMLPEEHRGRIVLISDGVETEGSLAQALDELEARGVAVDVLPIQYGYEHEVWLERLELPQFVKLGENYEAAIVLASLEPGAGRLVLKENGQTIAEERVEFQAGKNRFTVPIYLREAGYYEYEATIEVPRGRDSIRDNNTVLNYLYVEGEGRVLIVRDPSPAADERDWQHLARALRESQRLVEVQDAYRFPRDVLSLMPYDSVIFCNVGADNFDAVQMQTLKSAVYDLGTGFLMVGGANSFGPGGYHRTPVEDALPVTMDVTNKKILPKGALVIVLHTCEFPEGNTWAKRITKQAIRVLGAQDEVGALHYGFGGEEWIFELTPASEYEALARKINAASPGDMPSFARTMEMGLAALQESDASTKHMIIISDGDPQPPPPPLVSDFIKSQVSVSMVAIFPHGGEDISTMEAIAQATGGRYYFPSDPTLLPSIFIKEAKTLKRSMIQNRTVHPEVEAVSPVLRGIDALPPLHGYVLTSPKSFPAQTVLKAPAEDADQTGDVDPLLSTWKFGLGTTAAFTSDLSSNWAADWIEWERYRAFVQQLTTHIARARQQGHLRMWSYTSGNEGVIVVEDFHPDEAFLEVHARVSGPREEAETIRLKQVGPRRYQGTAPLWGKGRYQVMAIGTDAGREDRVFGGFIVPYSAEYLRFTANPIVLEEIASRTGGIVLDKDSTAADIYGSRRESKESSRPVFDWFLVALACLVPLDVAVRRVQLDWALIRTWLGLGKKSGPSSEMLGSLLERKQAVGAELEARRGESPLAAPTRSAGEGRPAAALRRRETAATPPRTAEPIGAAAPAREAAATTTERLLELKRKRQRKENG